MFRSYYFHHMLVYKHMRCFHMPPLNKKSTKKTLGNTSNPYFRSVLRHSRSYFLALRSCLRKRFAPGPPPRFPKNGQFSLSDESWKCIVLSPWWFSGSGAPFGEKQGKEGGARKPCCSGTSLASTLSLSLSLSLSLPRL